MWRGCDGEYSWVFGLAQHNCPVIRKRRRANLRTNQVGSRGFVYPCYNPQLHQPALIWQYLLGYSLTISYTTTGCSHFSNISHFSPTMINNLGAGDRCAYCEVLSLINAVTLVNTMHEHTSAELSARCWVVTCLGPVWSKQLLIDRAHLHPPHHGVQDPDLRGLSQQGAQFTIIKTNFQDNFTKPHRIIAAHLTPAWYLLSRVLQGCLPGQDCRGAQLGAPHTGLAPTNQTTDQQPSCTLCSTQISWFPANF